VRIKNGDVDQLSELERLLGAASRICHCNQARLMLNIAAGYTEQLHFDAVDYDGIHADSQLLAALDRRPTAGLFSASCHDAAQLQKAVQLGADFAVLSPVKFTQSHPDSKPIGWSAFADLIEDVAIPVYALGGVAEQDIEEAWQHGGQGIAAISAFWPD
jgi:8-oxo-dGTP diphosphatase